MTSATTNHRGAMAQNTNDSSNSRDEGILWDVLNELDRERERRAELEAQVRDLMAAFTMTPTIADAFQPSTAPSFTTDTTAGGSAGMDIYSLNPTSKSAVAVTPSSINGEGKGGFLSSSSSSSTSFYPGSSANRQQHRSRPPQSQLSVRSQWNDGTTLPLPNTDHQQQGEGEAEEGLKDVPEIISSLIEKVDTLNKRQAEWKVNEQRIRQEANQIAEQRVRQEILTLQAEKNGLVQLIDALTSDNDAVVLAQTAEQTPSSYSSSSSSTIMPPATLPLHVVRLLEIMPWDTRAQRHATAVEEVHEWQTYDAKSGTWSDNIRHFPNYFKALPVTRPGVALGTTAAARSGREKQQQQRMGQSTTTTEKQSKKIGGIFLSKQTGGSSGGAGGAAGGNEPISAPRGFVLTNATSTKLLNVDDGYPLPNAGTWEWVGGWRIDRQGDIRCDIHGWSYAELPKYLVAQSTTECFDSPFGDDDGGGGGGGTSSSHQRGGNGVIPQRIFRRRKWLRQRVLVSYPSISERTRQYLKLLAQNATLNVSLTRMTEQLVSMKTKLTESEERLERVTQDMQTKLSRAEAELKSKDERIKSLEGSLGSLSGAGEGSAGQCSDGDNPRVTGSGGSGVADRVRDLMNFVPGELITRKGDDSKEGILGGGGGGTTTAPPSEDANSVRTDDSIADTTQLSTPTDTSKDGFSWKRLGRGSKFLEQIKRSSTNIASAAGSQFAKHGSSGGGGGGSTHDLESRLGGASSSSVGGSEKQSNKSVDLNRIIQQHHDALQLTNSTSSDHGTDDNSSSSYVHGSADIGEIGS